MSATVCIFRPDHLGDVLLTTPALRLLRTARPDVRIVAALAKWSIPLVAGNPCVDDVVECTLPWLDRGTGAGWGGFFKCLNGLRRSRFDVFFNFRVAAKSALATRLSGATERWGFDHAKCAWAHSRVVPHATDRHAVELYCSLVRAWCGSSLPAEGLEIYPTEAQQSTAERILRELAVGNRFAVCAPGAGYPMKRWPEDRWVRVVEHLVDRYGFNVLLCGSGHERPMLERIRTAARRQPAILAGGEFGTLAALFDRAALLVTVDSFVMHLGAARRRPLVTLFGPTSHHHWGPWPPDGPFTVVTQHPNGPYFKQDCPEARECMIKLSADMVVQAIDDRLAGGGAL